MSLVARVFRRGWTFLLGVSEVEMLVRPPATGRARGPAREGRDDAVDDLEAAMGARDGLTGAGAGAGGGESITTSLSG